MKHTNGRRDVVIVGAGPAGSTLALLLARAGVDVLLLDRAVFPRSKPCGDCLSAEAARLLDRLGLYDAVTARPHALLRGWRIFGPHGAHFSADFADLGDADPRVQHALAIARAELDAVLLDAARAAGAEVRTGCTVTDLLHEGEAVAGVHLHAGAVADTVAARLTVGADGLRSRVARRLGAVARRARVRKLSLTAHCLLRGTGDGYGEMHVADGLCLGVAPLAMSLPEGMPHNVTLVADAERFGADVARDASAFFHASLRAFPALRELPARTGELLASGPFDVPMSRIVFDGAVLVGDAAGYFDPFTGQGVYHAMAAAEQLAAVVLDALRGGSAGLSTASLAPYAAAHRRLTAGPRRVQHIIDAVLSRPLLAERAIRLIARRPAIARGILAVTSDLRPARSLLSPSLALSLLVPRHPHPQRA